MNIPVYVQKPCKPQSERHVGYADDDLDPKKVAWMVGVPIHCFLEGKVIKRKGNVRWSIVADIEFAK